MFLLHNSLAGMPAKDPENGFEPTNGMGLVEGLLKKLAVANFIFALAVVSKADMVEA